MWLPLQINLNSTDRNHFLLVAGRLKPGVTPASANAQLHIAASELQRQYPDVASEYAVTPIRDAVIGDVALSLWILLGAVTFVLLIACSNVANLLLIRGAGREREIGIRMAIGASRVRILRQFITESVVLSIAAGVIGLVLGMIGIHALLGLNPGDIPRIGEQGAAVHLDWRILTFATFASLITGILSGLARAMRLANTDLARPTKKTGGVQRTARSFLVVSQMSLALILLTGAALMIRTFVALRAVNAGFDARNVIVAKMALADQRFEKTAGVAQLVHDGVERVRAIPGVTSAGASCCVPLEGTGRLNFSVMGRPVLKSDSNSAAWVSTSSEYFDIFKINLIRGRTFTERDDGKAPGVVIINQAMARQFWPDSDPLRDRLVIAKGAGPQLEEPARQIIGVVGDVRHTGLDRDPQPTMYVPLPQVQDGIYARSAGFAPLTWIVRTELEPKLLIPAITAELRRAGPGLAVTSVRMMDKIVTASTSRQDFNLALMSFFGGTALFLAVIGIYGMMA